MVSASRDQVWDVLVDPATVARLMPVVRSITDDGQGHWRWRLAGLDVAGRSFELAFTVAMAFDDRVRIDFTPAPPSGSTERAAVTGWYLLEDPPDGGEGVKLSTSLDIAVDLPLPRLARGAVEASMQRVIDGMGASFSKNLLTHLGARQR